MRKGIGKPLACAAAVALCLAGAAHAQTWPVKTVRIIVPFGPGGGTDIQGRLLGKKFYETMGQTFVVENRSGAGGMIGTEIAAKSPPDGHTILFTTASLSVSLTLYGSLVKFDAFKELAPISWVSSVPLVLCIHPSVPVKSVKELVALARKSRLKLPIISYKGGGPAITALITGEVDFVFATALAAQPHVKSGRVKPIAVTTLKPSGAFPGLPTMASVYPGFEADNWYAMFFPAGTPKEIIGKMNAEIVKALNSEDIRQFMAREGADPVGSTPEELGAYFRKEYEKYAKIIKSRNIELQ
jgi:tripartite-type tricarboxylate transporter receptor subunit TctC